MHNLNSIAPGILVFIAVFGLIVGARFSGRGGGWWPPHDRGPF
jgi:hypothetical protein